MGSLLSECLRHCLPPQQGGSNNISYQPPRPVSSTQRMTRSSGARIAPSSSYAETTATDDDTYSDEETGGGGCHVPEDSANAGEGASPLAIFWHRLRSSKWGGNEYASLEARTSNNSSRFHSKSEESKCDQSPTLRAASNFEDTKGGIPSIALDEVVLPGSELQRIMAKKMSLSIEDQGDECVICMEGFDETNPRMPTLCGCGENKTYFHLPCLYQWIEQSRECPSCRKPLRWEEF